MATSTMKVKVDLDVPALLVKLLDDALHEERALRQQLAMAAAELGGIPPQTLAALRARGGDVVLTAQDLGCAPPAERLQLLQEREAWKAEALAWRETWIDSPTWPYVLSFARLMEAKLDLNRHKGNREGIAVALKKEPSDVPGEAADVANFAMMVADVVLGRGWDGLTAVRKPAPARKPPAE